MTKTGLEELKELMMRIENIRDTAKNLMTDIHEFYTMEEDVEDRDAHMMLTNAVDSMASVVVDARRAMDEMQKAYKSEKALMEFYETLLGNGGNSED